MFQTARRTVAIVDLAGYARLARTREDLEIARLLDAFYQLCHEEVASAGGRVVKFMGDACFAVFEPERTAEAVEAILRIRERTRALEPALDCGVNMHLTSLVEGEFGPEGDRRYDVVGGGVNQAFLLGNGPGLRVSEPVYRKLPSSARGPWTKRQAPAIYVRE